MTIKEEHKGKDVIIFCKDSRRYSGMIIDVTYDFLEFLDYKTGKVNLLSKNELSRVEIEGESK